MAWLKRLSGIIICLCAVFIMSHNSYATSYFQPIISIGYSVSRTQCNSSTCWTVYGSEYTATAVLDSYDQETGEGSYHFEVNSNVPTWCSGYQCYINIRYFMVNTRYLSNGSYVTPDFSNGSMLHIKIVSGHQFYLGDGTDINFNMTGQGYTWNLTGGDVMLNSWTSNSPYLCWGEGQGICETHYYEDLTQTGGVFTSTLDLDTSKINTNVTAFYFGEWPYNVNQDGYVITTGTSFVQQFEWKGSSTDLTFKAVVSTDSTFSSVAEGNDIENEYYENNMNAINNINGQSPSDIDTGNGTTATNLIGYITNFISYLTNISPASDCNIVLAFPNYAGGSMTFNLCQFKDNFGTIISVFSSLVLIVFYIPLAYKMLSVIYSEIRSFTNG